MSKVICFIGLGSNLHNPLLQLKNACHAINRIEQSSLLSASSVYQSSPLGPQDQPDFMNAVIKLTTSLQPLQLLTKLQRIEKQQLRVRNQHWGPRTIDLDLLLYGSLSFATDSLTIPHPGILERDFVIQPLLEIQPDAQIPNGPHICDKQDELNHKKLAIITGPDALLSACS